MIPDLSGLTADVLRDLTNVGTVRRASREVEESRVEIEFTETDAGLRAAASDDTVCILGAGAFDTWLCDCATGTSCRHIVRAVLAWQAYGAAAPAAAATTQDAPAADDGPTEVIAPRTAKVAVAARERYGLIAAIQRGDRVSVVLHAPSETTVRFGADADPRFARCECGESACAHLDHALVALEMPVSASGLVVVPASEPRAHVVAAFRSEWHRWWDLVLDVGLGAADELIGAAVRLAGEFEDAGYVYPGAAVRDLAAQLAHHAARDAELSPARLVRLVGEVEARLRRLGMPEDATPVPTTLVAGISAEEQALGRQRLVGLGSEFTYVGGWARLRTFVGDIRTGAVRTLDVEGIDTDDVEVTARSLSVRMRAGSLYVDWASGTALLPKARRRGPALVLPRGTAPVARSLTWPIPEDSPLLAANLACLAADVDIPAPVAPRGTTAGIGAVRVAEVGDVRNDPVENLLSATLTDAEGATARLELVLSARARAGNEATAARLAGGEVSAIAGRWVRRADALTVTPTLIHGGGPTVVVPFGALRHAGEADAGVEAGKGEAQRIAGAGASGADPWRVLLGDITEAVGRLLVLGARRSSGVIAEIGELAAYADSLGLLRWGANLQAVVDADRPSARSAALLDLAVLLAFGD